MTEPVQTDYVQFPAQPEEIYGIKTVVKLAAGFLWDKAGLMRAYLRLCKERGDCPCLVLAYHRVLPRPYFRRVASEPFLIVSEETFRGQMLFLKEYFRILTLDELVDILSTGSSIPEPSCVLTFDDGWRDTFLHAYPILKDLSMPASVFVTTGHVDSGKEFWFDTVYRTLTAPRATADRAREVIRSFFPEIQTPGPRNPAEALEFARSVAALMKDVPSDHIDSIIKNVKAVTADLHRGTQERHVCSWDELGEMISSGLITIGSHTVSHAILTKENDERCWKELTESKRTLEERLGVPVKHFCYPNGNNNLDVENLVRKAGYRSAFPSLYGVTKKTNSPFAIPRMAFSEQSSCVSGNGYSKSMFSYQLLSCLLT